MTSDPEVWGIMWCLKDPGWHKEEILFGNKSEREDEVLSDKNETNVQGVRCLHNTVLFMSRGDLPSFHHFYCICAFFLCCLPRINRFMQLTVSGLKIRCLKFGKNCVL